MNFNNENQNRRSGGAKPGCLVGFFAIPLAFALIVGINIFRTMNGHFGGGFLVLPILFIVLIMGFTIYSIVKAMTAPGKGTQNQQQQYGNAYMPPRGGTPQNRQGYQNARPVPQNPQQQYRNPQAYSAPRAASTRASVQASHLCDDESNHGVVPREDNVDMMVAVNEYSLAQLDRKRFERPLNEEERKKSADAIQELYRSGIISREEYNYKLEELRRR